MAAAEGNVQDGGSGGCHVFGTTDGGKNWTEIYTYKAEQNGACLTVEMLSETEAWVGTSYAMGTFKSGAEMSHTVDGGKTWKVGSVLREIGAVT